MLISPYPPHRKATVSVIAVTCLCNVRTIHTIPVRVGNLRGGDGGGGKKKKVRVNSTSASVGVQGEKLHGV